MNFEKLSSQAIMIGNLQLSRRKVVIYGLFLTSTATFLLLYSRTDTRMYWHVPYVGSHDNDSVITIEEEDFRPPSGFLVHSDECQIPDVDPYDQTIKEIIELHKPLDCSKKFPPLTYTVGDMLMIDPTMLTRFINISLHERFSCCFSSLRREGDGRTDNGVRIEDKCTAVTNGTLIDEEFIEVKCFSGKTNFYRNYHSFIHDKPLVEKRCEDIASKMPLSQSLRYSIMIVGVDSVSRLNMHRQFPETLTYLKENMDAIEMYGYNKVGDNTFPNLVPFLTGYHQTELPYVCRKSDSETMDNCPLLWNRYRDVGYRTFYAEDTPYISTFNYLKPGFYKQPTDFYFRPFILKAERNIGLDKRLNTHFCVGPITEAESVLQWLEKFCSNFHNRSYFAMAWINSMTHDYLNSGSYVDRFHYNTLKRLHTAGSLNNTVVIYMSDHGMRWGAIRNTHIGRLEERLPTMLISFPPSFKRLHPGLVKIVRRNSHRLTTPFDLYATLQNLVEFNGTASLIDSTSVPLALLSNFTSRARSLFSEISGNRSCSDASIAEHWCTCHKSSEVSTSDAEVRHVASYLVSSINSILKPHMKLCSALRLDKVAGARLRSPMDHLKANEQFDIFDYTVIITTKPGGAVFEGTVRFVPQKHTHSLLGSISRLNIYGNQSACVSDAVIRKYCYCRNNKR